MCRKTATKGNNHHSTLIVSAGLFLLYFFSVHFGALNGHPLPAMLILVCLLIAGTWSGLRRGEKASWLLLSICLLAGILLWSSGYLITLFYLPPLLVNLMLLMVFSASLLPGNTPLITQFSMTMKGELDAKALRYTHRVTLAWVVFFAFLLTESLILGLFAPPRLWSIFANFLNYVFLLLFFVVEYRVRVYLFPEVDHPGFFGFIRDLLRLDRRRLGSSFEGKPH